MTLEFCYILICLNSVWKEHYSNVFFARHCDVFLLLQNYVIYLFNIVTFFDNVRITLYFGTFELRIEITLQLLSLLLVIVTNFCYITITLFIFSL